jgi:hypothetical protein
MASSPRENMREAGWTRLDPHQPVLSQHLPADPGGNRVTAE